MNIDRLGRLRLEPFKRPNFFNGLVATPKYWNEIQDYHYSKENFYNNLFHGNGIIENVLDNLKVEPIHSSRGSSLVIVVNGGAAIDRLGRCIFLYEPQAITIDHRKYKLPTTIYVTISYKEVMEEYYQSEDNPDFQGYQKKIENARVELRTSRDRDEEYVELARIYLEENSNGEIPSITEAENFANPGPNAIDLRHLNWASISHKRLSPYLKNFLVEQLDRTRNIAQIAYDALPLPGFRELQVLSLTAKMLTQCGEVRFDDVVHILHPVFDTDNQIVQEMLDHERKEEKTLFSTRESFTNIKNAVFEMGDLLKSFDGDYESVDKIIKKHEVFIEGIKTLFITKKMSMQDITLMSHDLPRILIIGDQRYTLVDYIDTREKESVESHQLRFANNRDISTANITLAYPDGQVVRETLKRYIGGSAFFNLKNIIKKRRLLLIRRTDIAVGNYSIDVTVDKEDYRRKLTIDSADTKFRWRNSFVVFEEDEINNYSLSVEFALGESGRDNFGRIWAYQRL